MDTKCGQVKKTNFKMITKNIFFTLIQNLLMRFITNTPLH